MTTQNVSFSNHKGETLSGRLEVPGEGDAKAYAVFAHCFTCGKAVGSAVHITRALSNEGIATLRFDFTGLSESEGDFAESGFEANVEDLVAAANFVSDNYAPVQLMIGHSLGGTAAIQAAASIDSVRAVCSIGSPFEPEHALELFGDDLEKIREEGRASVTLAGRTFEVTRGFVEQFESAQMETTVRDLKRALLVMHSPIDGTVGVDHAGRIFNAARHPRSFVSLDKADHMLNNKGDAQYAGRMVATWATRYLA